MGRCAMPHSDSGIAARPETGNWQVQQARDAQERCHAKSRGMPLEPRDAVTEANHPKPPSNELARIQNASMPYRRPNAAVKGGKPVLVRQELAALPSPLASSPSGTQCAAAIDEIVCPRHERGFV